MSAGDDFDRARELLAAQEFAKAESVFRAILDRDGAHAGALKGLAALLAVTGRADEAAVLLRTRLRQEPGDDAEIASFCQRNFGVTFPLMAKVDVNGDGAHPVFKYLCSKAPGAIGPAVKWNFTKFLVSRDGATIKRYGPTVEPKKIEKDIVKALEA